jgi:aryl-alcohol dehydrogenase-like predicted oxidoreductase
LVEKFVLGTANFGMEYGISFKKVDIKEALKILERSVEEGVWGVDTAVAYGHAEDILGEFFSVKGKVLRVIDKLPHRDYAGKKEVEREVKNMLKRLNLSFLDCLLLHSFRTFELMPHIVDVLKGLKEEGFIKHYGISVYHTWEVESFYHLCKEPIVVEFPLNVFDRRFTKHIKNWKSMGFMLFARSVFLQGLFFLENFEGHLKKAEEKVKALRDLAKKLDVELSCLLLSFVAHFEDLDGFIVGVDGLTQFEMNLRCLKNPVKLKQDMDSFEIQDEDLILPYRWFKPS